jgi:hypothetical protein
VKTKELTLKQIFSVPCSTCGAAPEEACELHTGALPTEPRPRSETFRSRGRRNEARQTITTLRPESYLDEFLFVTAAELIGCNFSPKRWVNFP